MCLFTEAGGVACCYFEHLLRGSAVERFAAPCRRKGRAAHCRTLRTPHCQSQAHTHDADSHVTTVDKRDASDSPVLVSEKVFLLQDILFSFLGKVYTLYFDCKFKIVLRLHTRERKFNWQARSRGRCCSELNR